jgi:hypothetical protein
MFVPVDIGVEITKIKEERSTFAVLYKGQSTILDQAPQLPFADAEIVGSLPRSEEATVMMRWGWWKSLHRGRPSRLPILTI